jgi:hypothetical protein
VCGRWLEHLECPRHALGVSRRQARGGFGVDVAQARVQGGHTLPFHLGLQARTHGRIVRGLFGDPVHQCFEANPEPPTSNGRPPRSRIPAIAADAARAEPPALARAPSVHRSNK